LGEEICNFLPIRKGRFLTAAMPPGLTLVVAHQFSEVEEHFSANSAAVLSALCGQTLFKLPTA
jgi:hypothetical protein